jgi:hypothetical protein
VLTDEGTIDFDERPVTCPYCGKETVVAVPPQMETILVGRAIYEHCVVLIHVETICSMVGTLRISTIVQGIPRRKPQAGICAGC